MDRTLIKKYIDNQPQKIVTKMDLDKNKIEYQGIRQGQIVNEIKGDEEMSRSFILTRLVNELGYSLIGLKLNMSIPPGVHIPIQVGLTLLFEMLREMHFYLLNVNLLMPMLQMIETRLLRNSCTKLLEWSEPRVILFAIWYCIPQRKQLIKYWTNVSSLIQKSFLPLLIGKCPETFPIRFLPDMVRPRRLRISKHPQKT